MIIQTMKLDIKNIFQGKTVTIVGGGSSLIDFDFKRLKAPIIAVNYSCYYVESEMIVALDKNFHKKNKEFLDNYKGFLVSDRKTCTSTKMIVYDSDDDWTMQKVNLSGFTALSVAIHLGAEKIYLLGFDGGYDGNRSNFYPGTRISKDFENVNEYYDYFKDENIVNFGNSKIKAFEILPLINYN